MTEAEWLVATELSPMLAFLRGKASDRKLRLFGLDCCRLVIALLDPRGLKAVGAAERYADGLCSPEELEAARLVANEAFCEFDDRQGSESAANAVESLCHAEGLSDLLNDVARETAALSMYSQPQHLKRATRRIRRLNQCRHLRDIFGNPFRPVAFSPAWRTDTAVSLARQMYESRQFGAMPILADALQDAGCDNDGVLNHCRGDGAHVRGCWVVDLVLGKE